MHHNALKWQARLISITLTRKESTFLSKKQQVIEKDVKWYKI